MPDLESLILMALVSFLLKQAAKILEQVVAPLFKKMKGIPRRDYSLESQQHEATVLDERKIVNARGKSARPSE